MLSVRAATALQDGTIPKLHLTTDLLAMLIPGLPKAYPHQFIRITGEALTQPIVAFDAQGFTLTVRARGGGSAHSTPRAPRLPFLPLVAGAPWPRAGASRRRRLLIAACVHGAPPMSVPPYCRRRTARPSTWPTRQRATPRSSQWPPTSLCRAR